MEDTMGNRSKAAVIIPAYNEQATIKRIAQEALVHVKQVIVVDDHSNDSTAKETGGLGVTLLRNDENLGKTATLWRGIEHAINTGAEQIITMDGDGQHSPDDIPRLITACADHTDTVVIGMRLDSGGDMPRARYNANRFANFWISWAAGAPLKDSQSGFRLYPVQLFSKVKVNTGKSRGFVFESEILIEAGQNGFKALFVPIDAVYNRGARPSHFRPVFDIAKITIMVAGKLFRRGMYPRGLYRSLTGTAKVAVIQSDTKPAEQR